MNVRELYLFDLVFFFLLVRCPEAKLLNCMVVLFLIFFRNLPPIFHTTILPIMHKGSLFHIFASICYLLFFSYAFLKGIRYFLIVLVCISLMINGSVHLFIYLLAICVSSLEKMSIQILCPFLNLIVY